MLRGALVRALLVLATTSAGACGASARADRPSAAASSAPPHVSDAPDAGDDARTRALEAVHRATRETDQFIEAMSAFMSLCDAPDCFEVQMLIGAHTMHQPRLDETLPKLADELDKVHLKDAQMQSALEDLSRRARIAGAALARAMDQVKTP